MTQDNSLAHTHWTYKRNQEDDDQRLVVNSVRQRPIRKFARDAWMMAPVDSGKNAHDVPTLLKAPGTSVL